MDAVTEVIQSYAETLQGIYEARTAGDHTWTGVLFSFARDYDFAANGCKGQCPVNDRTLKPNAEHKLSCPVWKALGVTR